MVAVARARVAEQPPEARAPRVALAHHEHERRGLAEQQAAPAAVEGPHTVAGERAEGVEAAQDEAAEDVVAAGDHDVRRPRAQQVGGGAERGRARRARGRHRQDRAPRAEPPRERVRGRVVEPAGGLAQPAPGPDGALELLHATERGPEHHPDAVGRGLRRGAREQVVRRLQQQARGAAVAA